MKSFGPDQLDLLNCRLELADGRSVSLHAFVDESRRNNTYLLAVALVPPGRLHKFRKVLRCLLMPGQKELHCKKETPSRRKAIASRMVEERVSVRLYRRSCDQGDEQARQACLRSSSRICWKPVLIGSSSIRVPSETSTTS